MSPDERQALREKHNMTVDYEDGDNFCGYCVLPYPCDVIKVLDATEPFCNHPSERLLIVTSKYRDNTTKTIRCLKCGEKL